MGISSECRNTTAKSQRTSSKIVFVYYANTCTKLSGLDFRHDKSKIEKGQRLNN